MKTTKRSYIYASCTYNCVITLMFSEKKLIILWFVAITMLIFDNFCHSITTQYTLVKMSAAIQKTLVDILYKTKCGDLQWAQCSNICISTNQTLITSTGAVGSSFGLSVFGYSWSCSSVEIYREDIYNFTILMQIIGAQVRSIHTKRYISAWHDGVK